MDIYFCPTLPAADCTLPKRPANRVPHRYFFFFSDDHRDLLCTYLLSSAVTGSPLWEMVVCILAGRPAVLFFDLDELFHARPIGIKCRARVGAGSGETDCGEDRASIPF